MNSERILFPASVVGSMPRSQFVQDLLDSEFLDPDSDQFRKKMDAAVDYILALQETAGLDVVTDGEYRRRSYIGIIADVADGFLRERKGGLWWHTVVEPMRMIRPELAASEVRYLRQRTDRQIKVCLPSPYLLGQRMWDAERSREAYPRREDFMEALVPIFREKLEHLQVAGADVIQFDDPHLCLFVDNRVRDNYANPDREVDLCVDLLNRIFHGFDRVKRAIHLCRRNRGRNGWVGEGGYEYILPALHRLNVDQYVMEFSIPVAGEMSVLKELPAGCQVGLGCVDCRGTKIDSVEEIVDRVEKAMVYLEPQQIILNPDCGFAPGNAAEIPIDEAYVKLCHEVKAARILRERYS